MERNYGWVIVAAGAVITCVALGAMFALPVYLAPIAEDTGWTRAGISGAMTIGFIVMGVAGFAAGALSDRIGARPLVIFGGVLIGIGLFIASRTTDVFIFQLAYGGLMGVGVRHLRRSDHGDHPQLVRQAPRPRDFAGLDRRRHRADDLQPARDRAHRNLRLAHLDADHRRRRDRSHRSGRPAHPPCPSRPRRRRAGARPCRGRRSRAAPSRPAGPRSARRSSPCLRACSSSAAPPIPGRSSTPSATP